MSEAVDKGKKVMPLITTYNSDDSWDAEEFSSSQEPDTSRNDEDDDDRPLSQLRLASKQAVPCTVPTRTQKSAAPVRFSDSDGSCLSPSSSSSTASSSSGSDTEADGLTDMAFDQLIAQFASAPVSELIASKEFTTLRKRISRDRPGKTRPLSAYALFFKDVLPELKSTRPNARFGEIARLAAEKWDSLPPLKRQEYKRRGAAISPKHAQSILTYKTRLLNLNSPGSRQCSNPSCANPVRSDPRWNGQYCSTECVRDHCRLTFTNWRVGKRLGKDVSGSNGAALQNNHNCPGIPGTEFAGSCVKIEEAEEARPISVRPEAAPVVAKQEDEEKEEEERSSLDRLRRLVSDADAKRSSQQPMRPLVSEPGSCYRAVSSTPAATLQSDDSYMPSALSNRKPLFESLRICAMPFSVLAKPEPPASPSGPVGTEPRSISRSPSSPASTATG